MPELILLQYKMLPLYFLPCKQELKTKLAQKKHYHLLTLLRATWKKRLITHQDKINPINKIQIKEVKEEEDQIGEDARTGIIETKFSVKSARNLGIQQSNASFDIVHP